MTSNLDALTKGILQTTSFGGFPPVLFGLSRSFGPRTGGGGGCSGSTGGKGGTWGQPEQLQVYLPMCWLLKGSSPRKDSPTLKLQTISPDPLLPCKEETNTHGGSGPPPGSAVAEPMLELLLDSGRSGAPSTLGSLDCPSTGHGSRQQGPQSPALGRGSSDVTSEGPFTTLRVQATQVHD